jgi:protease IV
MGSLFNYIKNLFLILILLQIAPPLLQNLKNQYFDALELKTKVGCLHIRGIIYDSSYYSANLKKLFENKEIKAILLKIESPGAAAGSAEAIANEINLLKQEFPKPIVTLCENICTSGSYYIACTTNYIVAPPSALIGSIGTKFPYQFKVNELIEKLHIQYVPIVAGAYKDATDPFVSISPEQKAQLQQVVDDSYQNFIEHVARNRSAISLQHTSQWANGKVFTARQALQLGLVDEIGSSSNAINHIKKLAIIEGNIEWVTPVKDHGWWNMLQNKSGDSVSCSLYTIVDGLHTLATMVVHASEFLLNAY